MYRGILMPKIKLNPKSSGETESYGAFVNVDYDNAIVEAEYILEQKGHPVAYVRGSELYWLVIMNGMCILRGLNR